MRRPNPGLLRDNDFRQLFAADVFSQVSTQILGFAMPLVAVVTLDVGELEVGVLTALSTVAFLLVGLPAGAWVDRMRRRNVLMVADVGRALVLASVPLAWWTDTLTIWQLYVVVTANGVLTVFFDVAYQSYLPFLVGRDHVVEGNSKLEAVHAISRLGGPTLAGWLVQWLTAPFAIVANVVGYVGSAFFVRRITKREPRPTAHPDAHLGREIAEGLRFVAGNPLLRSIAMCTGWANFCMGIIVAMEMVFLARTLGLPPGQIGLFMSVGSIGGLAGAMVAGRLARWFGQGPMIWMSLAFTTPFLLLLPLAEPGWRLWLAAGGLVVASLGSVVYNVGQVSFRQRLTPERLLGRMNATIRFLVWGVLPLGGLLGGALGEAFGARTTLWIAGIGACAAFLPAFLSPLRRMRELPTEPVVTA